MPPTHRNAFRYAGLAGRVKVFTRRKLYRGSKDRTMKPISGVDIVM